LTNFVWLAKKTGVINLFKTPVFIILYFFGKSGDSKLVNTYLFIKMKYYIVVLSILVLYIQNTSCSLKQTDEINYFKFINGESSLQNCLIVESVLSLDTTIEIAIIDGNNDGNYYTNENPKSDPSFPDRIVITDGLSSQYSGSELKDSILLKYHNNNFLIKIDIENRSGTIEKIDTFSKNIDVYFYNKLSNEKVYSLNSGIELNLLDIISQEFKYTIVKNWAPFCEPCIKELAKINVDSCRIRNYDLLILVDSIYVNDVNKYFTNVKLKELVYLCDYSKMNNRLKFNGYPSSIIFSNNGNYLKYCSFLSVDNIIKKYAN
jgi:thiol-disulfide isomerase/thioredoxin